MFQQIKKEREEKKQKELKNSQELAAIKVSIEKIASYSEKYTKYVNEYRISR